MGALARHRSALAVGFTAAALVIGAVTSGRAADGDTLVRDHVKVDNDKATKLFTPGWSTLAEDSTSATFASEYHGTSAEYSWTVPKTLAKDGSDVTITATAHDTTGNRMYAYIGVSGDAGSGLPVELHADADKASGNPDVTATKTFTVKPRFLPSGEFASIKVDLGPDGPGIYYFYKRAGTERKRRWVVFRFNTDPPANRKHRPGWQTYGHGSIRVEKLSGDDYQIVKFDSDRFEMTKPNRFIRYTFAAGNGKSQYRASSKRKFLRFHVVTTGDSETCRKGSAGSVAVTQNDRATGNDRVHLELCDVSRTWTDHAGAHVDVEIDD